MSAPDALLQWLTGRPTQDGASVVGWRVEVVEGLGLRVGIRASELGGPYEGPAAAVRLAGNLELHWSDGRITRANLDRQAVEEPASGLAAWRADAVPERDGSVPPLAEPAALPAVQVADPLVQTAVTDDPVRLLGMLMRVRAATRAGDVRRLDASLRASAGRRLVANSRGFRASWDETTCSLELWADETAGVRYARRALPTDAELDALAADAALLTGQLRSPAALPTGVGGVLLAPAVVEELVARLLLPNLSGAIRDGRSPFTRTDLDVGSSVLRSDLDLVVDTTLPFELASAPCSPEGVPAGRVELIAGGRLVSPVLDLAMAQAFGRRATPTARGRPVAVLAGGAPCLSWAAALELLGTGVVVRDLPGLHTQSSRRSSYALVAPDAQVVTGGVAGGRCAVRLQGSLLDQLRHAETRLIDLPEHPMSALILRGSVSIMPA